MTDYLALAIFALTYLIIASQKIPLMALATASNLGSVMTLVGNPQNMLVGIYSGWSYGGFFLRMLPIGLLGLALDFALIYFFCRQFDRRRIGGQHDRDGIIARSFARAVLDVLQNRRPAHAAFHRDGRGYFGMVCDARNLMMGFDPLSIEHQKIHCFLNKISAVFISTWNCNVEKKSLMTEIRPVMLLGRVREAGQEHVWRYWERLTESSQRRLLQQISAVDFDLLARWHRDYIKKQVSPHSVCLQPAEIITLRHQRAHPDEIREMTARGEAMLRAGKVAAVLAAAGQASRLGFDKPKGAYLIGPISKKSFFQLHAEKLLATCRRYRTRIPWYIMTNERNGGQRRSFLEAHDLFGYPQEDVFFFEQDLVPALDENGKLILDAPDHIFTNPNGHGGTLMALEKSGALADMRRRGIEEIFYFQIDNVLLKMCDPLFLGYHAAAGAEMSAKVCAKRHPHEKVGVIGKVSEGGKSRLQVIEYSDMSAADKEARTADGALKYNAGSIAIHLFKRTFIEREVQDGMKLPWHVAHKQIPYLDESGTLVQPDKPNGYKFETFIFDALGDAQKVVVLEVERREEFSPVKNAGGEDSPETARRDMCELHASWLEQAGVKVPRDGAGNFSARVEISPLFALDAEELKRKITPSLRVQGDLYLQP